ncbi:hypothetical protein DPV73_08000 [Leptospira mayottensis]|uniref:Uncharacterized protein n=1 Tax=Leptospira mayottensis TaxID=1137606 RepID=A0ABN5NS30_9LEPT|nr:hypothetical protein DQM28_08500 [Leptospira mayottensis]AXR67966.1 hypothetical protein DPV73_08000 [Leptospira mayottensis]
MYFPIGENGFVGIHTSSTLTEILSNLISWKKFGRIGREFHSTKMATDRALCYNSFGIFAAIAFAFVMPSSLSFLRFFV